MLGMSWAHVLLAPYTKVEESFNLHATHDVLVYGIKPTALANYDHFVFPGAVPRTFIGSILLAWLSTPGWRLQKFDLVRPSFIFHCLSNRPTVRLVLATVNALAVSRRFGRLAALYFILFTLSQFHIPFWMGRTLPNMFAFISRYAVLVNVSTYLILTRVQIALSLLTFTAVVFRAEVALYLGPLALQACSCVGSPLPAFSRSVLVSGLLSVALTTTVDSYFWRQLVWPEFSGIYFKHPPFVSFTRHLPRMAMSLRRLLLPPLCFMGIISALGHKEWRFIVYVVPMVNVAAAVSSKWMAGLAKNRLAGKILYAGTFGLVLLQAAMTYTHTIASIANYPGGEALKIFNDKYTGSTVPPHVHISNLAAQTGASLFLQEHEKWIYNKTENISMADLFASQTFTHLISEPVSKVPKSWMVADTVEAFDGWRWRRHAVTQLWDVVRMSKSTHLLIMKRT
ncbi:hypothetical protein BDZ89DRAFT_1233644 [Hymenopellis radicata]|nr:hypothetical protein BDZ89DRAFT_1233644 [Hymenopellis radicata]